MVLWEVSLKYVYVYVGVSCKRYSGMQWKYPPELSLKVIAFLYAKLAKASDVISIIYKDINT